MSLRFVLFIIEYKGDDSLSCLKDFGIFISFGNASGNIDPIDIGILAKKEGI